MDQRQDDSEWSGEPVHDFDFTQGPKPNGGLSIEEYIRRSMDHPPKFKSGDTVADAYAVFSLGVVLNCEDLPEWGRRYWVKADGARYIREEEKLHLIKRVKEWDKEYI